MSKKIEKILLLIIKTGLGLTLFTPFIISNTTLFPFVFGKAIAFQILTAVMLIFYLILILINAQYFPQFSFKRKHLVFCAVSLYILMLLITTLTSQDSSLSFWGTQERMTGVFSLLHFFAYFIILIGVLPTKKNWLNLLRANALVIFIFGLQLLIKTKFLFAILGRYEGAFGNPDIIGSYLLLALFLIIVLWIADNECRQDKILAQAGESKSQNKIEQDHQANKKRCLTLVFGGWKKIVWKIFYSLSFSFAFLGLILAGTRAAYVGLFAGFLCFFFLYIFFSPNKYKQSSTEQPLSAPSLAMRGENLPKFSKKHLKLSYCLKILAVLILFLTSGGFLILGIQGKLPAKITQIQFVQRLISIPLSLETTAENSRILSWQAGFDGFKEKPIWGWGLENYSLSFNKYIKADYFTNYYYANSMQFDKAHNKFFEVLTETGLLGLTAYLFIFADAIILLFKKRNKARERGKDGQLPAQISKLKTINRSTTNLNWLLISLLLAYFVQNLFTFDTPVSYLLFFLSLSFISFKIKDDNQSADKINKSRLAGWQFIGLFLLIIAIPWLIYIGALKPYFASRQSIIARAALIDPKTENLSLSYYQRAVGYHTFVSREATYQVCRELIQKASQPDFKFNDYFKEYTELCVKNIEPRTNKKIFHFEEVLLIGKLYSLLSRWDSSYLDKAETVLRPAMLAAPLRSQIYSDLGLILLQKQNYPEALLNFNKALELKGNESYNYWQIALVYLGQKNFKSALEFIEKAKIAGYNYNNLSDLATIGFIYSQLADWEQALAYYQNASTLDPKNIEILGSIALVYKEKGDRAAARVAANQILEIAPGAKEEIEKFLRDLE